RSYAVEISYSKKMLRLHDSNFQYSGQGDRLPITEDRDHILCVPAQLELTSDPPVDVRLVVDTGAAVPIAFTREFVEKHQLMHKLKRASGGRVQGMGGKSQISVAEAKSLKLGNFLFRDLKIALSRDHTGGLAEGNYDGIMGAAMLSKFDLIFDLEHRQLILESNFAVAKSGAGSGTEQGSHSAFSSELSNSLRTGKITGNFFSRSRKAGWIAGFCERCVQEQGINREF